MYRALVLAGLVLVTPAPRGERIEAVYREGATLVLEQVDSIEMEMDEVSLSSDGVELPPERLDEEGIGLPDMRESRSLRLVDQVLAASEGRPTRVRRTFERLRQTSVVGRSETEKTGPLEGKAVVLQEEDGEVLAELENEKDDVDEVFLNGHRLTSDPGFLLPGREVSVGDSWPVEDDDLREFLGVDSRSVLFEVEEQDVKERMNPFDELFDEASWVSAEVEFVAIEERDGLRCAVLALTFELRSEMDDLASFGMEPVKTTEGTSVLLAVEVRGEGRLWYALAEGRPVELEQTMEGTLALRIESESGREDRDRLTEIEVTCSLTGELEASWSVPE